MQREKLTRSGPLLEADFYPIFNDGRKLPTRAPKSKPSTEEQQRYNRLMAVKKLIRLVNANFDNTDYWFHPTYEPGRSPQNEDKARRDMVNFLRRVKTRRAAKLRQLRKDLETVKLATAMMPGSDYFSAEIQRLEKAIAKLESPFKYVYVIEETIYQRGKYAGRSDFHFHVFMTGGLGRTVVEKMWPEGIRTNCNRYQPEKFGPETAALYMSKDPRGSKRFCYSRNLDKPDEKKKDGKVSRRTVEKMAKDYFEDREYWEKRYKGYRFIRCYSRFNEHNGHWYVSAIMYRSGDAPPKWAIDDWITADAA